MSSKADTVAMEMVSTLGGLDAWSQIPYLRFDFSSGSGQSARPPRKHLWDLQTGRYRLEYSVGQDTLVTVVFNVNDTTGTAYMNGERLGNSEADQIVAGAHRRHINDTYWLLAPFKVFDEGVTRSMDSEEDGQQLIVLSFDGVGYTPGDQYWLSIDKDSKLLNNWRYQLQGRDRVSSFDWVNYQTYNTLAGPIQLANEKVSETATIFTNNISFPEQLPDSMFSSELSLLD